MGRSFEQKSKKAAAKWIATEKLGVGGNKTDKVPSGDGECN